MSSAKHTSAAACAVHKRRSALAAAAVCAACTPLLAWADSDTDSFTVTAHVLAACEVTAEDLDFGDYNPVAATDLDADSALSVRCTNGTSYDVGLSLGGGAGATTALRGMVQNTDVLHYVLYRDQNRTQLWGMTDNVDMLSGVGNGLVQTIDVYGRVPKQQAVPVGDYDDTIVVTVAW